MFKKTFGVGVVLCSALLCALPAFAADPTPTEPLAATSISEVKNGTTIDSVAVTAQIASGDIIKVYAVEKGGKPIAVATSTGESVTIYINQLGKTAGKVYVSKTSSGSTESTRTAKDYVAEDVTGDPTGISYVNNTTGVLDTVTASATAKGDIIKLYATKTAKDPIAVGEAGDSKAATLYVEQLGVKGGTFYVSATTANKLESVRVETEFDAEAKTDKPSDITVTNNLTGTADTIRVTGLKAGDVVNVYPTLTSKKIIGTATVASGQTEATVTIDQIGVQAGKVYVSAKGAVLESDRAEMEYAEEQGTPDPALANITVTNNVAPIKDTVVVGGLKAKDIVNVYKASKGGTPIGTKTVDAAAEGTANEVTIEIDQLGLGAGKVYVAVKSDASNESKRILVTYTSEKTTVPTTAKTTIVNNYGETNDKITVEGLIAGQTVKIYDTSTATTELASTVVASDATSAVFDLKLSSAKGGKIYVGITVSGKTESKRIAVSYASEPATNAPAVNTITVTNKKTGLTDTVAVSGLTADDTINVYATSSSTQVIGTGAGNTTISLTTPLLAGAGKVYVAVKGKDKLESPRTAAAYTSETSVAPFATKITVANTSSKDSVTVSGLKAGDEVNVYNASGTALFTKKAVASDENSVTLEDSDGKTLTDAGTLYVTVTSTDKAESAKVPKAYTAEA